MSNSQQYSLFPIKNPELYKFYERQRDAFWVPAEIELDTDVTQWRNTLSDYDRKFLTFTLAFFSQADGIVLKNLSKNFDMDTDLPEARLFYGIQAGIEAIHWEMYSLLIETLISDPQIKTKAFDAIAEYPCIGKKAAWIEKWMDPSLDYADRLVAFACTEGIFFSAAFASIYFYKNRNVMPGLILANKFIARDEGLHRDFGCAAYKHFVGNHAANYSKVVKIIQEAVEIEDQYVDVALNVQIVGMNAKDMKTYVRFVADHLLHELGYQKIYNVANPWDWMDLINLAGKQNFFEGRVSEYSKRQVVTTSTTDVDSESDQDW